MNNSNDVTMEDVNEIRRCAEELQLQNVKHYGGKPGIMVLRERSERTLAVANKLESKLTLKL